MEAQHSTSAKLGGIRYSGALFLLLMLRVSAYAFPSGIRNRYPCPDGRASRRRRTVTRAPSGSALATRSRSRPDAPERRGHLQGQGGQGIGRNGGNTSHRMHVGSLRGRRQIADRHVFDHAPTKKTQLGPLSAPVPRLRFNSRNPSEQKPHPQTDPPMPRQRLRSIIKPTLRLSKILVL